MMRTYDDDLLEPEVIREPYAFFGRLREERPVHFNERLGAWVLTRFSEVSPAFRDPRLSADRITPYYRRKLEGPDAERFQSTFDILSRWMVFTDPPTHTRLRKLVSLAFTPRSVAALEDHIEALVDERLSALPPHGEADLMEALAYPLPVDVISDMLGVPREDRYLLRGWSADILVLVFGAYDVADRHERAKRSFEAFADYLGALIAARRRAPREDLVTALVEARDEEGALSEAEVIATIILLLFGGHETTTNLIANGTLALLDHPDERRQLAQHPELWPRAVEEMLRYDGPSKAMWRVARAPAEIGRARFSAGDKILLVQAGANRDPSAFAAPNALDVTREKNPHCGFGFGIHYCLGAPLARAEGRIAIRKLFERCPELELARPRDALEWQPTILNRSLTGLPVRW